MIDELENIWKEAVDINEILSWQLPGGTEKNMEVNYANAYIVTRMGDL
jgi:hypothetical protein